MATTCSLAALELLPKLPRRAPRRLRRAAGVCGRDRSGGTSRALADVSLTQPHDPEQGNICRSDLTTASSTRRSSWLAIASTHVAHDASGAGRTPGDTAHAVFCAPASWRVRAPARSGHYVPPLSERWRTIRVTGCSAAVTVVAGFCQRNHALGGTMSQRRARILFAVGVSSAVLAGLSLVVAKSSGATTLDTVIETSVATFADTTAATAPEMAVVGGSISCCPTRGGPD